MFIQYGVYFLGQRNYNVFFFIVAPCVMESIHCSLTNKCTFY